MCLQKIIDIGETCREIEYCLEWSKVLDKPVIFLTKEELMHLYHFEDAMSE